MLRDACSVNGIPFVKMQAAGNDFVVIDARRGIEADWPALASAVCDRHFGVGADGLLVIAASQVADARMSMFNPDGSEDMCGNGLRCVSRFVVGIEGDQAERPLRFETIAGTVAATSRSDGQVTVVLPPPRFAAADLPADVESDRVWDFPLAIDGGEFRLFAVATGTTHTVIFRDDEVNDDEFNRVSPLIENHPIFPERTSVSWVNADGRDSMKVRVWERGAGETLACGTGACAVAAVAHVRGLTGRRLNVTMKGGRLLVELNDDETMGLTGAVEFVFRGVWTGVT